MALTELQLPTKENFYRNLQNAATQMDNLMQRWENLAEFINFIEVADLDAMNIPSGQVRTDLVNFRLVMDELVSFYKGDAVIATNPPHEVVDKIRSM